MGAYFTSRSVTCSSTRCIALVGFRGLVDAGDHPFVPGTAPRVRDHPRTRDHQDQAHHLEVDG